MELDDGHGKQSSKRLDALKDNREHVFACQSETDAELRVMRRDETRQEGVASVVFGRTTGDCWCGARNDIT